MLSVLKNIKILAVALGGSCAIFVAPLSVSETFDRGQALYENHCKYCHESWAHERDGRKVNSKSALRHRVAAWSIHSSLDWSEEEIDDVAAYLNDTFYQLTD